MFGSITRWIVAFVVLTGCSVDEASASPVAGERPRGTYVWRGEPRTDVAAAPRAAKARIIYMNRHGGTFTPGWDDSSANSSTIPYGTSTIRPWDVSDAGWQQVMDCMKAEWAPFDVEITDVEPAASVEYIESVVAGRPQDVGMGSGVGGVSPFDCGVIERSIVFTFAEVYGNSYREVCETASQEVAHSFGLDHEYLCEDPMTYLFDCGDKWFQDIDAPCGEYSARSCNCGGSTQNSIRMLTELNGAADLLAPEIAITAPADGATVEPAFEVDVDASDDVGVQRVELLIDGALADTLTAPPWVFATDALPDGAHAIETIAYDRKNSASASISVTVDSANPPGDPPDDDPPADPPGDDDPVDDGGGAIVGGCATGAGTGGGSAWILFGAALWLARRRRR